MPEIEVALTPTEYARLQRVADALGKTVSELVAEELRERYALACSNGDVVPLRRAGHSAGEG
ncbi:MAG TPA: hypothetical protein VF216_09815 [Mizugakiibacter sp.]